MKIILKEDLLTVLKYDDRNSYDEVSFKNLLNRFGDDYFFEDGKWTLTHQNGYMKRIREHSQEEANASS